MSTNEKSAQGAIMCDACGKEVPPFQRAHDCDGGEALRKAAHELFAPVIPLIQKVIEKSGTGILRGVFEVVYERDALRAELSALQSQCSQLADALETTFRLSDQLTDWINRAGPALKDLLDAYERRVRSACENEAELAAEPWKCREWLAASAVLNEKPVAVVDLAALSLLPKEPQS